VTYANVWDGIDVRYEAVSGGIIKSTYIVAPGADVAQIHLRYNVPVAVEPDGSLRFAFETGEMRESAPVAWQEIAAVRVPIQVSFQTSEVSETSEVLVGFAVGEYNRAYPLVIDPTLAWNTFLGSASGDAGGGIAVDGSGNVFVAGHSNATWGTPVNAFAGGRDVFAAKLNSSGVRQWHTFLGSASDDYGSGIAIDGNGNVYVVGTSYTTWETPVNAHAGGADVFAAKFNSNGVRQWNTFLGSGSDDWGDGITVDGSGNVYVVGSSSATWGAPVNAYAGGGDAFAAKLNSNGVRQWNTFLGSGSDDSGGGIAVDGSGNVYVTGSSGATWGVPVNPHAGWPSDAFVAKLNSNGARQWNTFLGSADFDSGSGIEIDGSKNIYVTGTSWAIWGMPVNAFAGGSDAFAAKLNNSGVRQWHTFLGSGEWDWGYGIAVDGSGNVYVVGESNATWGTPVTPYGGGRDAFAAMLNSSGVRQWNAFLGSASDDYGNGIAADGSGNVYVIGGSNATWRTPVDAHAGGWDAFVAKLAVGGGIVSEARLDIGMPYDINRGCASPYIGCGGPYHGFYKGVCTDLVLDAYNAGVPFNIQNALYQDYRANPGRYQWGSSRNAEDMRRYFKSNQQLLPHSQSYQPGDIAFFDWPGDGFGSANHVNIISEVDASGRPLRMVDASGVYGGNPSGRAFEHSWSSYYDQYSQGHGRLSGGSGAPRAPKQETLQVLRVTVDSASVALRLQDANGKFTSDTFDENLVASNSETFIPYIPGGAYADLGTSKIISVTQPVSNTTQYVVQVTGNSATSYQLTVQTIQNDSVTAATQFNRSIASGEMQGVTLQLSVPGGVITFTASDPAAMPKVTASPTEIQMSGRPGTIARAAVTLTEVSNQQSFNGASASVSNVMNQAGQTIAGTSFTVTPANFSVPASGSQNVQLEINLANTSPGLYQGNLVITSTNGGTLSIPLSLSVEAFNLSLPIILR
jgi:uncharacterized protein YijF (DUF1287 family)